MMAKSAALDSVIIIVQDLDEAVARYGRFTGRVPTRRPDGTAALALDRGTILLGGLKAHSEARNEFGTPILSKIPYVNRLFKNAASSRVTNSLMLMVTPRIIIQEEEEDKLGTQTSFGLGQQ